LEVVIEAPVVDFTVAANLVGEETVVEDGEETEICAKPGRQNVQSKKASLKDLNYILRGKGMFCIARKIHDDQLWRNKSKTVVPPLKIAELCSGGAL
jgi:hypothetical protein